ncbi:hypothetical protein [Pedobacter sp. MC2016-24]|uniref:hypothetical protein n=1 Tax=Pedobacter sp. MC2016-24 TaxID=2780090 RepID=UPI00187EDFFE|nr:hypothetical protein [Pedobacter sp. MC2016-24]MBE9598687.1 hypothetical protein [Pedobacter sp. MC2016-24]
MSIQIREMRKLNFHNKVITPSVINRIATIIDKEADNINDSEPFLISYSIEAADDSSYESQSKEIFNAPEIMDTKMVERIHMRLQTLSGSKSIELQLLHCDQNNAGNNFMLVSGNNSVWVNGVMSRLSEIIDSSNEQPQIMHHLELLQWVVVITFNFLYFRLFFRDIEKIENGFIGLGLVFGIPLLSLYLAGLAKTHIEQLWPDVELQTGPDHLQQPQKKRRELGWIMTMIILPILLGFITDVLKNWLHLF